MIKMQGISSLSTSPHPSPVQRAYAFAAPISVCSLLSNKLELMGISGVWNGFFITASESGVSVCNKGQQEDVRQSRVQAEKRGREESSDDGGGTRLAPVWGRGM